ncbi:DsrE family protein [Nocardioides pocheonensis]|uniref:DsrE family protein n=1 Tax=Nocardioides pocheonensis TaxID=661485 RepID=UPI003CCC5E10
MPARRPRTATTNWTECFKGSPATAGGSLVCGTCLDARGLAASHLIEEASRSTMDELAGWVVAVDQVLTF